MMNESSKKVLYHSINDIPICKEHGKPEIEEDELWKYSTDLLHVIKKEIMRCLSAISSRSPLSYPGVMSDEEGLKNWMGIYEKDYYNGIVKKIESELKKRKK